MNPFPDLELCDFAPDAAAARRAFCAALASSPLVTWAQSRPHPLRGPVGEPLATELAWLGALDARRVLVVQSAVHGVEGFAGAAAQLDFLRCLSRAQGLAPDLAILFIHQLNPWGFAWLRRTDDCGVDLNRNFVDFGAALPENPGYAELADAVVPRDLEPATLAQAEAALASFEQKHGRTAYERAVSGGQYTHPHGLFYGGRQPSWSRQLLEELAQSARLRERDMLAVVDLHTGLGPFGYGEVICDHPPGSAGVRLARDWFGASVTEPACGTSTSVAKAGLVDYFWHALLPERCCFVTLEFGTFSVDQMFRVLRADHVLHRAGLPDFGDPETKRVKDAIAGHFCPRTRDWQEMVLLRARQVLCQALAGLQRS